MPGPFVPFVLGTHILLVAASGGPPQADIQATCRDSERDLLAAFGNTITGTAEQCVKQENEALEVIKKNWATYGADAKVLCVQSGVYSPSYVEWLTCLEMDQDVKRIRTENAKAAQANANGAETKSAPARRRSPNARTGSQPQRCPFVQFLPDGSIASVIAC